MFERVRNSFSAKLMLLIGLVLVMPAVTYFVAIIISSSSIKQFYVRIIDEYGRSEKEGEEFILEEENKKWIKRVSIDVARQADLFIEANPAQTARQLAENPKFLELAAQPVGENGYTILVDNTGKVILVHPNAAWVGTSLMTLMDTPGLSEIIPRLIEGKFSDGEYLWQEDDGKSRLKYLFATPVPHLTGDRHRLSIVATADMDEVTAPARFRSQGGAVKHILNIIEDRRTRDLLTYSLLASGFMGISLIIIAWLLLRKGILELKELSKASAEVGGGNFDIKVGQFSEDEFGDVANAFNQMATTLKETVISRNYYERAKIEAEKANRLKSEFLTSISHEIRTPLNGIIGFSEVLLEEEKSEERIDYLRNIINCGDNLLALINEILDLSKIEAGKIVLNKTRVSLGLLLKSVIALFENICEQKGLELSLDIDPETPDPIETDEVRLRQILVNLVDNAIKFTEKGGVRLKIGPYGGPRKGSVIFSVEDTGKGIPEDKRDLVFVSFARIEPEGLGGEGGTGLGLSISANLVALLGGEIWLESGPGKGSIFSFTIPSSDLRPQT